MPLAKVQTVYLIKELETDGHRPMKFLCSDGSIYYCKYRNSMKKEEIDFLCYEIVCNYILKRLDIPSPDLALIEIQGESFDPLDLKYNRRYVAPGTICLGSKEVPESDLITGIMIADKKQFNNLINPRDLVKIAAFDMFVDNTDRGRNENYNLLLQNVDKKSQIVPIDHAFAFGGVNGLRLFNPRWSLSVNEKLVQTPYFQSVIRFIDAQTRLQIASDCLNFVRNECTHQITNAFADLPAAWGIASPLAQRMINFLTDEERFKLVNQLIAQHLKSF